MKSLRQVDLGAVGWLALLLLVVTSPNILNFIWVPGPLQLARVIFGAMLAAIPLVLLRIRPRPYLLLLLPVMLLVYADLIHMVNYGKHLSLGAVAAFFYTDSQEATEFFRHTSRTTTPIAIALVIAWALLYRTAPARMPVARASYQISLVALTLALPAAFDMKWAFPASAASEIHGFYQMHRTFQEQLSRRSTLRFEGVKADRAAEEMVIVLVLGESASRHHFGIYGYERPTTPRMSVRQDLVVFADASAPANLTQYSLYVMLTPATVQEPALFHKYPSILGLANSAGFDTFWLSNQSKLNRYNNEVTVIAEEANQRVFRSTGNVSSMDEGLLPHLNRALDGAGRRKFVVLHTLGSHVHYEERYPSSFSVFTGKPLRAKVDDPAVWELINTYDNSILYTDYFLDRVIASVEATNKPGCVVYVSDHGEYLSPDKPISGHGYPRPLRQEADIPLLVWCSAEHWRRHPTEADAMARNKALPVAGEDLFYALADLMDVDFNGMDTRRSFFGVDYVAPRTRWIMSSEKPRLVEQLEWEVVFE